MGASPHPCRCNLDSSAAWFYAPEKAVVSELGLGKLMRRFHRMPRSLTGNTRWALFPGQHQYIALRRVRSQGKSPGPGHTCFYGGREHRCHAVPNSCQEALLLTDDSMERHNGFELEEVPVPSKMTMFFMKN